jgi:alkyl sulfatase BDS1-like metallo-beta-lactamase superfamily hydrolase
VPGRLAEKAATLLRIPAAVPRFPLSKELLMAKRNAASEFTRAINDDLLGYLPFEDRQDFEDAARGLIAPLVGPAIKDETAGWPIWDPSRFDFIDEDAPAPATVNPSLWRQSQLCAKGGLFKVVDRLYQVRNQDISNLTIVEGDTGLILFDPLISSECSRPALELYFEHRPRRPVVAVVYSHSHVDHYGGVKAVVDEDDVTAGKVRVIAPEGFLEAAVSENVMAGHVMSRRALYQYGSMIPFDEKGNVGLGLGMAVSNGSITLIPPTETITETGQKLNIDGLTFEFMLAPDMDRFFNYLGVRLNGEQAAGKRITLNFVFTDTDEQVVVRVSNGALSHVLGRTDADADATVTMTRAALDRFILGATTLDAEAQSGEISVDPDIASLDELLSLLDTFDGWFNIIEPWALRPEAADLHLAGRVRPALATRRRPRRPDGVGGARPGGAGVRDDRRRFAGRRPLRGAGRADRLRGVRQLPPPRDRADGGDRGALGRRGGRSRGRRLGHPRAADDHARARRRHPCPRRRVPAARLPGELHLRAGAEGVHHRPRADDHRRPSTEAPGRREE